MKIKLLAAVLCSFIGLSSLFGQIEPPSGGKRINDLMLDGDRALLESKFELAITSYKKVLKRRPGYAPAKRGMGVAHRALGNLEEAEKWYANIVKKHPRFSVVVYHELGLIKYRLGKYDEAAKYFDEFKMMSQLPREEFGINGRLEADEQIRLLKKVGGDIYACIYARDSVPAMGVGEIQNLGPSINSNGDEYFPFLTNNETVMLFTKKILGASENLYYSEKDTSGWKYAGLMGEPFNTQKNEGMTTCTRDNIRVYFTACNRENVSGTCDIQSAVLHVKDSVHIDQINTLAPGLNSGKWESQASISCDGLELYFASTRPGGEGKTDLWVSYLQGDGTWGEPQNLGPGVNTKEYEEAPFISNDGQTLFFSSTGHLGMGEQDLYLSRRQPDGTWGLAVNMGNKVNTAARELGFFLTADGRTGYFASDRLSGMGGMDIFKFDLSKPLKSNPITFVEGFVKDSVTHQPVKTILDLPSGQQVPTDENGRFFLCLSPGVFLFSINQKPYYFYPGEKDIPEWDNRTLFQVEILLQKPEEVVAVIPEPDPIPSPEIKPEPLPIPKPEPTISRVVYRPKVTVYFDFDKYNIKSQESLNLSGFLSQYKNHTPDGNIEIKGYCDFKGSVSYNMVLSNKRAKAVFDYLVLNGVPPEKIKFVGLGEINDDAPRWKNRRVDVSIREIIGGR